MRHQRKRHKLGRNASHRKATLIALGNALITHKRVTTTVSRAKALRAFIEPILTRAKDDSRHNRRQAFRRLRDKQSVTTLFTEVAEKIGERPGGYTRVVRIGRRAGDAAPMAVIELVDYSESDGAAGAGPQKSKRTRRGRRRGAGSPAPAKAGAGETPAEESSADVGDASEEPTAEGDALGEAALSGPDASADPSSDASESDISEAESKADRESA